MEPQGRRAIEAGPVGEVVSGNLLRLRSQQGLTTRALADALERVGRRIPASGITRMEKHQRQITVDDLMALAKVFDVPVLSLLNEPLCARCSDNPPAGFTCNYCGMERT